MALADKLANPPAGATTGLPCSIGALLDRLEDAERAALQTMLDDRSWSQTMIWETLKSEGYTVGRQSVNRHRGNKCRCTA